MSGRVASRPKARGKGTAKAREVRWPVPFTCLKREKEFADERHEARRGERREKKEERREKRKERREERKERREKRQEKGEKKM